MKRPCLAVAYSAGRDSTALLHVVARACHAQAIDVLALHVHHGLSPHADAWCAHAQAQCLQWAQQGLPVQLWVHRVQERPAAGDSIEAWARQARYRALTGMAQAHGAKLVLLAHHRGDQAETFLLQALRGAGVAGLAAMPFEIERGGITWSRPWVDQPRASIESYVQLHQLSYIDDESNQDARFARNRLRLDIWPQLLKAFPQAESALCASAGWAQQTLDALQELAELDLAHIADEHGLRVVAWLELSVARRVNALRAWLKAHMGTPAPSTLVIRLQAELAHTTGPSIWPLASGQYLRRYRGRLTLQRSNPRADATAPEAALSIARAGLYRLPGWHGVLEARRVAQGGVPLAWLAHLELRERQGGEQFQSGLGRPPRSLKKQYQAAAIAQQDRTGPLVYSGGQLVFVPGLGIDVRVLALPGQAQLSLTWHRSAD